MDPAHVVPVSTVDTDALFVDGARATPQWTSVADVLVYPDPTAEPDADALCRNRLSNSGVALVIVRLGPNRWLVRDRAGERMIAHLRGCPVGWAQLLYRWLLTGRRLGDWPLTQVGGRQGRPAEPG